jgi:hypothetical protein
MGEIFHPKVDRTAGQNPLGCPVDFWGVLGKYYSTTFGGKVFGMENSETWVEDDRVLCGQCDHAQMTDFKQSMPAEQMEKHRKVNAKPLQWMFDVAKVRNGWATVTWKEWQCQATGMSTMPFDLKHRCHLYCKATAQPSSVESDAWWLD